MRFLEVKSELSLWQRMSGPRTSVHSSTLTHSLYPSFLLLKVLWFRFEAGHSHTELADRGMDQQHICLLSIISEPNL